MTGVQTCALPISGFVLLDDGLHGAASTTALSGGRHRRLGRKGGGTQAVLPPLPSQRLEYELTVKREESQSTTEEMGTSDKELKPTNEELDASKEKLQSLNEELNTLNRQLLDKVRELERLNDDLTNFTEIAGHKRALQHLRESEERFRLLFEKSPLLLCEQDWSEVKAYLDGIGAPAQDTAAFFASHSEALKECRAHIRITQTNEAIRALFGSEEGVGLTTMAAHCFGREASPGLIALLTAIVRGEGAWNGEGCVERASGDCTPVLVQWVVMPGHERRLARVLVALTDISMRKRLERKLEWREHRLRTILDNAAEAIMVIDFQGRIQDLNQAAKDMFGFSAEQVIGRDADRLIRGSDAEGMITPLITAFRRADRAAGHEDLEWMGRRSAGTWFPLDMRISRIDHLALFILLMRDLSEQRRLEQEVVNAATVEQERIGREIHDSLGQRLAALGMLVSSLETRLQRAGNPESKAAAELGKQLQETITEARALARGLAPLEIEPMALGTALSDLVDSETHATGITCRAHIPRLVAIGDALTATHLYRIAQEAVNNAVKHAGARHIDISLEADESRIHLCVVDDGRGLAAGWKAGLGVRIMCYRAKLIDGLLVIDQATEGGTRVCCSFPIYQNGSET